MRGKLTFEQAEEIRAAKPTTTLAKLAKQYGVSIPAINAVCNFHCHRPAGMPKPPKAKHGRPRTRFSQPCKCGCGEMTAPGAQYRSGHWTQVHPEHWRYLKQRKTDAEFIAWVHGRCETRDTGYVTPCLLWTGPVNAVHGYPTANRSNHTTTLHRHLWQATHGPILGRHPVHHRCHQRRCQNLEHMALTTTAAHIRHHKSKITAADAAQIRALHAAGRTLRQIHSAYPQFTNVGSIANIVHGRRWALTPALVEELTSSSSASAEDLLALDHQIADGIAA